MFERFTDRARRVVSLAQIECQERHHSFIGTEHLLLGLLREGGGVAFHVLDAMGVKAETIRDGLKGPETETPSSSPPFTPRTKKVLEMSLREALQLGHNYIGTEHILLGLLREGEGAAIHILIKQDVAVENIRRAVMETLAGYHDTLTKARQLQDRSDTGSKDMAAAFTTAIVSSMPAEVTLTKPGWEILEEHLEAELVKIIMVLRRLDEED